MRDPVRIVAAKEPYLTYRTRRLMPGDEVEVPRAIARIFVDKLGYATMAARRAAPAKPAPSGGDDLNELRAFARSRGIEVDGRWGVKRIKSEIAKH